MLKLIIEDDEGRKTVVPFVRDEITIGRQEGNTIRLTERNVSRRHARLMRQNGHVFLEDLGSYNGIRINGDRIQGQVSVNDGDLIQIGDYDLAVQREETASTSAQTSPLSPVSAAQAAAAAEKNGVGDATLPRGPVPAPHAAPTTRLPDLNATSPLLPLVSPAKGTPAVAASADDEPMEANPDDVVPADEPSKRATSLIHHEVGEKPHRPVVDVDPAHAPRLVVLNTEFAGKEFPCVRTELRVGRTDENDIALDHRSLSRTHCKVVREANGEWRVIDLQSANGLMVNGEPYAQSALRSGDVLELGHVKLKFVGPNERGAAVNKAAASTAIIDDDDEPSQRTGGSKLPVVAVALAAIVLLAGLGYVFMVKPGGKLLPGGDPVTNPTPNPTPNDPAAADRAAIITQADGLIAELKWDEARTVLSGCKVDGSACPEALTRLSQLDAENGVRTALLKAEKLLAQDKLVEAKNELDAASGTVLLKNRYAQVVAQLQDATQRKLQEKQAVKVPVPQPNPNPTPPANVDDETEKLVAAARASIREASPASYQAARGKLEDCLKLAPKHPKCHMLLGATYARLKDNAKGAQHYRMFLQYASPDDPLVPGVKKILEEANR